MSKIFAPCFISFVKWVVLVVSGILGVLLFIPSLGWSLELMTKVEKRFSTEELIDF